MGTDDFKEMELTKKDTEGDVTITDKEDTNEYPDI